MNDQATASGQSEQRQSRAHPARVRALCVCAGLVHAALEVFLHFFFASAASTLTLSHAQHVLQLRRPTCAEVVEWEASLIGWSGRQGALGWSRHRHAANERAGVTSGCGGSGSAAASAGEAAIGAGSSRVSCDRCERRMSDSTRANCEQTSGGRPGKQARRAAFASSPRHSLTHSTNLRHTLASQTHTRIVAVWGKTLRDATVVGTDSGRERRRSDSPAASLCVASLLLLA